MLSNQKTIAFVATTKPDQAKVFYEEVLGLSFVADEEFALVFEAGDNMLRIQKAPALTPAEHTVLGWMVSDIAKVVRKLTDRGARFEQFEGFEQDELGICTFPDGAQVAWFKDPDGNRLSLTEMAG